MAAPTLSDTARKVDRAVARLEELQCIIRSGRGSCACLSSTNRPKLSLHAGDRRPCCRHSAVGNPANPHPPPPSRRCQPSPPIATSRRRARVSACPPPPQKPTLPASTPSPSLSPPGRVLSSPPSSACSSSVVVRTKCPPNFAASKLPRTFFVDARPASANRPWRLSSSPSPSTTATSTSTTSNYIYTPSTNSTAPISAHPALDAARPIKSPSRFSPLHRQASKSDAHQTQPLLNKGPDLHHHQQHSRSIATKPKASPTRHRPKTPWFSQTRLLLPTLASPSSTKPTRRLSLVTKEYRNSPPRPLPALLTRLPTRRKKTTPPNAIPVTNEGQTPHSTPKASPRKSPTIAIRPLPLPPALQAAAATSTQALGTKKKDCHKRSTSCPRQRLLPLDANTTSSSSPALSNPKKQSCFSCTGKENCFSGCNLAVWPALRRSWSFSQQQSLDHCDLTGSGSSVLKHVKGHMIRDKYLSSQVYKVDSFKQELARDKPSLYVG